MWPEKLNCINKASLRCRATLLIFVKIPHCYSIPSLSASLLIGPSACPTGNLACVAKLLAAIWVKYSLQNALDMWEELLLCSSFFRNLTKSSYCLSYFFLLLRTLYFISSYSETVAGGCPTLVLLKRENNAKRGCPWRKIMPCPAAHTCKTDFFSRTATSQEHDCCSCPCKHPFLPCSLWKLGFHYCKGSWGLYWFWALVFQRPVAWHTQGWDTCTCLQWAIKLKRRASFFCSVLSEAEQSLMDEKKLARTVSRIWQTVL